MFVSNFWPDPTDLSLSEEESKGSPKKKQARAELCQAQGSAKLRAQLRSELN